MRKHPITGCLGHRLIAHRQNCPQMRFRCSLEVSGLAFKEIVEVFLSGSVCLASLQVKGSGPTCAVFSWEQMAPAEGVRALLATVTTVPVVSNWLVPFILCRFLLFSYSKFYVIFLSTQIPVNNEPTSATSRGPCVLCKMEENRSLWKKKYLRRLI